MSQRALNRALLARQLLLERTAMPAADAIEHLVALQAQVPIDPYVGLWTRLEGFDPLQLSDMLARREAMRAPLLRATLHLTTARDFLGLRPIVQPVLERIFHTGSPFARKLTGTDLVTVLAAARELMAERPRTRADLRHVLGERWPERDRESLAQAVTYLEPVVQVTPRGHGAGAVGRPGAAPSRGYSSHSSLIRRSTG